MTQCIICLEEHTDKTVEHIVPRSLGNIHYILPKGIVCKKCNQRFSKYEYAVLNSSPWLERRKEMGLARPDIEELTKKLKSSDTHRFMLMMMYESIYLSRRKLFNSYDFEPIRKELNGGSNLKIDYYKMKSLRNSKPVPGLIDHWRLRMNRISLRFAKFQDKIWFEFQFAGIIRTIKVDIRKA